MLLLCRVPTAHRPHCSAWERVIISSLAATSPPFCPTPTSLLICILLPGHSFSRLIYFNYMAPLRALSTLSYLYLAECFNSFSVFGRQRARRKACELAWRLLFLVNDIFSHLNSTAKPGAGKANVVIKLWGLLRALTRCCSVVGEGIRRGRIP